MRKVHRVPRPTYALPWIAAAIFASGCSRSEETPVSQAPEAQPSAAASPSPELYVEPEADPDEGPPPLQVRFSVLVEDATGSVECEWDFGDGSPKVKGLEPTHVYEKEEDYEVVTVCRDEKGISGEGEVDVFVEAEG